MKTVNPIRGREKIHTVACYDDTWNKFQNMKHKHHLTADEAMNILINNYKQTNEQIKKSILQDLDKNIQNKLKNL